MGAKCANTLKTKIPHGEKCANTLKPKIPQGEKCANTLILYTTVIIYVCFHYCVCLNILKLF